MSAKRVLVTGGTGFVGANLARRLLAEGHQVNLLVRAGFTEWRISAIRRDVRLAEADLRDAEGLDAVVKSIRPDWVFHLSAHGAYSWQNDSSQIMRTNVMGTVALVEACLKTGFEAFVNTGSSSEYGFKDHAPPETEPVEPNSEYAVAKASATLYCRFAARSRNVRITTLRLYSVYGPYEEPKRFMPTLIVRGMKGELPPLVDPEVGRDYVYVEDACDAYLLAATAPANEPGVIYNVGTGVQTSIKEAVDIARRELGIKTEPRWGTMPNRRWDTSAWVADSSKARRELGWHPRFSVERGFKSMVKWFAAQPALVDFYAQVQAGQAVSSAAREAASLPLSDGGPSCGGDGDRGLRGCR